MSKQQAKAPPKVVQRTSREAILLDAKGVATSCDPQVIALLTTRFHTFDQWKNGAHRGLSGLRSSLDHLLTRLLGARDFPGAAQVLSVLYHRFTLIPARCVQASLEILRRNPLQHKDELMQFYQTALKNGRLDQLMVYKEMLMLLIVSGDYYEAYQLYKEEMQELTIYQDAHLQGMIGMLCYWLLFIESEELRNAFGQRPVDENDDLIAERQERMTAVEQDSANSVIESRYLFKTSIGAHILYQEAVSALRRAISVSSDAVVFLEYYVQLLVLVGDIDRACDQLENFYHSHISDPHASRLLCTFLEAHFPSSSEAQVKVVTSWLRSDPASADALQKLLRLAAAGFVQSHELLRILAKVVDECGSDLHVNRGPNSAMMLWREFAKCVEDQHNKQPLSSDVSLLEELRSSRQWWTNAFFSRPSTVGAAKNIVSKDAQYGEILMYKAVVAQCIFGDSTSKFASAINSVVQSDYRDKSGAALDMFRRHFTKHELIDSMVKHSNDYKLIAACSSSWNHDTSILDRAELIKNTRHADRPVVDVCRIDDEERIIDQALIHALEEAVRDELRTRGRKRSFETMKRGIWGPQDENLSLPLYVELLEEMLYKNIRTNYFHLQSQLLVPLQKLGAAIPSWMEIHEVIRYLSERWLKNLGEFGHEGLLLRYESFLIRYLRKHAKSFQYWVNGVPNDVVHDAVRDMKLYVSRSRTHFPTVEEVAKWMRIKASRYGRIRRRLLRDYMFAMRFVAYESDFIETDDLVRSAMEVATRNDHADLLTVRDIERQAKIVLVNRYGFMVRNLLKSHRAFLEEYVRHGRIYEPEEAFAAVKRRWIRVNRVTVREVKAFMWLKRWELDNPGRFYDAIDEEPAFKPDDEVVVKADRRRKEFRHLPPHSALGHKGKTDSTQS